MGKPIQFPKDKVSCAKVPDKGFIWETGNPENGNYAALYEYYEETGQLKEMTSKTPIESSK